MKPKNTPHTPNNTTSLQESTTPKTIMPDDKFISTPNIPTSNNLSSLTEHEDTIPCTNPDTTPLEHKNHNPQKTPSTEKKIITTETIILCDSNGKHEPSMSRNNHILYQMSHNSRSDQNFRTAHIYKPEDYIIIHCGTNDIQSTSQTKLLVTMLKN